MQAPKPITKEQLIHYLVHNISLGTYDKKFLNNIYENNKPLTTNQNELLDKIVLRYSRQFTKKELVATDLINLPWTRPLIISSPEFTEARIYVEGSSIHIRTPYKKDYITKLKESSYPITWSKDTRLWSTDYCAETLKYVIEHTENHFSSINYSKDIQETINYLCEYEQYKYWNPTLVCANGMYYLMAVNEHVFNAVESLLENITPYSITKLVRYGVAIDDSVIKSLPHGEEVIKFAMDTQPTLESDNVNTIVEYLKHIECDLIVVYNSVYFKKFLSLELNSYMEDNNIKIMIADRKQRYDIDTIKKSKCSVFLTNSMRTSSLSSIFTDKVLHLVNSEAPQKVKSMYETV